MHPAPNTWQGALQVIDIDLDAFARTLGGDGPDVLDGEERQRAARMATPLLRDRFVAAHVATRRILGEALDADPGSLRFSTGKYGKPRLVTPRDVALHFNLSHCRGRALLALSDDEVGVDLEGWVERDTNMLAREVLAAGELERFHDFPVEQRPRQLTSIWAAKEALCKACGLGLQLGPHVFSVDTPGGWHSLPPPADAAPWWLQRVEIAGPFCAFVASRRCVGATVVQRA